MSELIINPPAAIIVGVQSASELQLDVVTPDPIMVEVIAGGSKGDKGSVWLSGEGIPSGSIGEKYDWYLDTVSRFVYEKTTDATWTYKATLKGDKGDQGIQGEKGDDGYTPIKGVDYFDGAKGDKGDQGDTGPKGDPGTTDYNQLLNPPNLSIYAEKSNVLEKDNTIEFTPDTDYEPATKKYVDDNVGIPAGNDTAIQFNDNGSFGGVDAFKYERVSGAVTIGESVEVLPNVPFAIEKDIDDYVQITFQNKSNDASASMDIVITADNGDDETHYMDLGVNSSGYIDPEYPVFQANDGYLYTADHDLVLGSGGADGKVILFAGGYAEENIAGEVDVDGINLPEGKTFRINGTPIGSAPDFLSLTDTPSSYTGQAGKVVSVKPAEDGLEFSSISGLGDMKASVYDPTGVAKDAFDTDNHISGTTNKVYTVTEQTKLSGIASGAEVNVQSDWNEADNASDAYIKNKPTIPSGLTPGDSVTAETSFGLASNAGVSTDYSRSDHTHGTPAAPSGGVSEEMAIAYAAAFGGI